MRKFLTLISIAIFAILSCSKEDEVAVNPVESPILIKSIVTTSNTGIVTTSNYSYDGNKLAQVLSGTTKQVYTYNGNLITKLEIFKADVLDTRFVFVYNDNKITGSTFSYTFPFQNNQTTTTVNAVIRSVYIYNNDGTILIRRFETNDIPNNVETENESRLLTYLNGNLLKRIESFNLSPFNNTTFEYDNKNSYYKNILGFDKLMQNDFSVNNNIKSTQIITRIINGQNIITTDIFTYEYTYAENNFPINVKELKNSITVSTSKFSYY